MDDIATRYIGLILAVALAVVPMTSYFSKPSTSKVAITGHTTDAAMSSVNGATSMCASPNPIHAAIQNCSVLPLIANERLLTFRGPSP
jgi:hypothetical protein